jgi:hypothetical protein
MDGKDARDFSTLVLIAALFALADALMKTPTPAGREATIQDFLVQRVDKAVVARHTAIRPFLIFPEPNKLPSVRECCTVLLSEFFRLLYPSSNGGSRELNSSHAGDFEEKSVRRLKEVHLLFD